MIGPSSRSPSRCPPMVNPSSRFSTPLTFPTPPPRWSGHWPERPTRRFLIALTPATFASRRRRRVTGSMRLKFTTVPIRPPRRKPSDWWIAHCMIRRPVRCETAIGTCRLSTIKTSRPTRPSPRPPTDRPTSMTPVFSTMVSMAMGPHGSPRMPPRQ